VRIEERVDHMAGLTDSAPPVLCLAHWLKTLDNALNIQFPDICVVLDLGVFLNLPLSRSSQAIAIKNRNVQLVHSLSDQVECCLGSTWALVFLHVCTSRKPLSVSTYFWSLARGLSGLVISSKPLPIKGLTTFRLK